VRTADPVTLSGGLWSGWDYESWFNTAVTYEATTGANSVTSSAVTLTVNASWLRHPGIPALSAAVTIHAQPALTRPINRAVLTPIGRTYPVVVTDIRRTATGTITFRTDSLEQTAALVDLLSDGTPLLLDVPSAWRWGIEHAYLAIADVTTSRWAEANASIEYRLFECPFEIVDRPAGGQVSVVNYATLAAGYGTYTAVLGNFATYNTVLTTSPL